MAGKLSAQSRVAASHERSFAEVVGLIERSRQRAYQAVNTELVDLYWRIGQYLHRKIEADGWAKGTVAQLATYIAQREPGLRGFSSQNLWRMRQFFEAYPAATELSPLLRDLPWSAHLHILSRTKRAEEREFYLRMATHNRWPVREVARQIDGGLFERAALNPPKLSTALREMQPQADQHFKDAYLLEFLALPALHSELDLHRSLLQHLGRFLTELGRDVRKPHENPAIGVLLCASKDAEVVEYGTEPHAVTGAGGSVPDSVAGQGDAGCQAARVLCLEFAAAEKARQKVMAPLQRCVRMSAARAPHTE